MSALAHPEYERALLYLAITHGIGAIPRVPDDALTLPGVVAGFRTLRRMRSARKLPTLSSYREFAETDPASIRDFKSAAEASGLTSESWQSLVTDFDMTVTLGNADLAAENILDAWRARESVAIGQKLQSAELTPEQARAKLDELQCVTAAPAEPVFSDFAEIIAGGLQPEKPTVASGLLYAGRVNEIHGEPSVGKTNIAVVLALAVLSGGGSVVYLDPEDNPAGMARRFMALGCRVEWLPRLNYSHNPQPDDFAGLHAWARSRKPVLVILDGLAEFLASEGLDENVPSDILTFFRDKVRPFADAGAAVLVSDHVVKTAESRGRWARGSGAKLGRYDGASFEIASVKPYSPTVAGAVRLIVSKDRNGGIGPMGHVVTDLHFIPTDDGRTRFEFKQPEGKSEFRPTGIMEKVSRHLEQYPESSKRDLRALGKVEYVDTAIRFLTAEGFLEYSASGPGKATRFTVKKPFRNDE